MKIKMTTCVCFWSCVRVFTCACDSGETVIEKGKCTNKGNFGVDLELLRGRVWWDVVNCFASSNTQRWCLCVYFDLVSDARVMKS